MDREAYISKLILGILTDPYVYEHLQQREIYDLVDIFEIKEKQVEQLQKLANKLFKENKELMQKVNELEEQNKTYKSILKIFAGNENQGGFCLVNKLKLQNAWVLTDKLADEFTKEKFELDDILYDIAIKIFEYRIDNNLTVEQLAEKLGTTPEKIEELESGLYDFSISELWWIAKKIKCKLEINFLDSWVEL